jgi:hypothetical protein
VSRSQGGAHYWFQPASGRSRWRDHTPALRDGWGWRLPGPGQPRVYECLRTGETRAEAPLG